MQKLILIGVLFSLLALISVSVTPIAQATPQVPTEFQYAAKFACGRTFVEGFVVIQSRFELDVVALYTAGGNNVETLHTERIPVRRIPFIPG